MALTSLNSLIRREEDQRRLSEKARDNVPKSQLKIHHQGEAESVVTTMETGDGLPSVVSQALVDCGICSVNRVSSVASSKGLSS